MRDELYPFPTNPFIEFSNIFEKKGGINCLIGPLWILRFPCFFHFNQSKVYPDTAQTSGTVQLLHGTDVLEFT